MDIATTIEGGASVITSLVALGGLAFMAGKFSNSVENLNKTAEKLSSLFDRHIEKSEEADKELSARLSDHETRITVLEKS